MRRGMRADSPFAEARPAHFCAFEAHGKSCHFPAVGNGVQRSKRVFLCSFNVTPAAQTVYFLILVVIETKGLMAEREGFEPPIALRLCLISSQVHSTGLCHLSALLIIPQNCAVELARYRGDSPHSIRIERQLFRRGLRKGTCILCCAPHCIWL